MQQYGFPFIILDFDKCIKSGRMDDDRLGNSRLWMRVKTWKVGMYEFHFQMLAWILLIACNDNDAGEGNDEEEEKEEGDDEEEQEFDKYIAIDIHNYSLHTKRSLRRL